MADRPQKKKNIRSFMICFLLCVLFCFGVFFGGVGVGGLLTIIMKTRSLYTNHAIIRMRFSVFDSVITERFGSIINCIVQVLNDVCRPDESGPLSE